MCSRGNAMNKNVSGLKHRRPRIVRTLPALTRVIDQWRGRRDFMALVPTMGALHAGHHALVQLARRRADRVTVSIFVNPAQFAPNEDLTTYPRTFAADVAALGDGGADLVWAPSSATMYPRRLRDPDRFPQGPALAGLSDAFRPHFFSGVATVVAKLLIQCEPDFAIFGEKDYQQLIVVTRLARDLGLKTRIVGAPTVPRSPTVSPLSSRNGAICRPRERAAAPTLYRVFSRRSAAEIAAGKPAASVLARGRAAIKAAGFALDYLEARDSVTLAPHGETDSRSIRLLVAARLAKTRLIDNLAVKLPR